MSTENNQIMEDLTINKYEDSMKLMVSRMNRRLQVIYEGGGKKKIEKHKSKGKLTARERINRLIDADTSSFEIGAFAGYDMYQEHGGCPGVGLCIK